jgi:hypothetical protein
MQREYTKVYPGLGKEGPTSSGGERVLYFLAPKYLRRGLQAVREGAGPKSQEKSKIERCLRC